jgi:metal-responsive CopG/Arc/MetJ family transcriptional regulator
VLALCYLARMENENTAILFVRVPQDLMSGLDDLLDQERKEHPGREVSRSDIVREILYRAVRKEKG